MLKWFKIVALALLCYFGIVGIVLLLLPHPKPLSGEQAAAMQTKIAARRKEAIKSKESPWDLTPKNVNPRAAKLLRDKFYWSLTDDDSPFGNDDGGDALFAYRHWRKLHPNLTAMAFVDELALNWEAPLGRWCELKPNPLSTFSTGDGYILQTDDQMIIGAAFAQLVFEGRIEGDLQAIAIKAIRNEQSVTMRARWLNIIERGERLQKMLDIVSNANR